MRLTPACYYDPTDTHDPYSRIWFHGPRIWEIMSSSAGRQRAGPAWGGCTKPHRKLLKARWKEISGAMRRIWRKMMQKPDCTWPLPSTAPEINSFVTLALMNLNNLYSFIYLGAWKQTPLIFWSIMNISSFVSCSETTEFTFISLSGLLSSSERFLNPNPVFDHSIMNILPACWHCEMTTLMINSW